MFVSNNWEKVCFYYAVLSNPFNNRVRPVTLYSHMHLSASLFVHLVFYYYCYLSASARRPSLKRIDVTNVEKGAAPRPPCGRSSRSHACRPADCGLFSFFAVQSRCRLRATAPPRHFPSPRPSPLYLAEFQNISRHVHVYVVSVAASQKGVTVARGRGGVGVEGWKRERERAMEGRGEGLFVRDECRCSVKGVLSDE